MMLDLSFGSSIIQSCRCQRRTASSRSRSAASSAVRTFPSPTAFHGQAVSLILPRARSSMRIRTVAAGATCVSTSAISFSMRYGPSVQR